MERNIHCASRSVTGCGWCSCMLHVACCMERNGSSAHTLCVTFRSGVWLVGMYSMCCIIGNLDCTSLDYLMVACYTYLHVVSVTLCDMGRQLHFEQCSEVL